MANLVPAVLYELNGARILLDAPAGDEERLLEVKAPEGVDDPRDRYLWPIAQHRRERDPIMRGLRQIHVDEALGVHVESKGDGATRTVGPGDRILDHGAVPLAAKRSRMASALPASR